MSVSEKWGTDVETAVKLALEELNATRDEVEVTVLEQPSRGFFGIGSKLALVRVELKPKSICKEDVKNVQEKKTPKTTKKTAQHQQNKAKSTKNESVNNMDSEIKEVSSTECCNDKEVSNESDLVVLENHLALNFLNDVASKMGLDVTVSGKTNGNDVFISVDGKDSGTIIGKRGQTLDAIQYLTSLVVNKDSKDYVRVVVDAENYRSKREKTLEKLAKRLAEKVIKTRRSVKLEPMNPYERKVIHATLQNHHRVITRSEGQDPYRRVIIELK